MPILKTRHSISEGTSMTEKGDKFRIVHAQEISPVAESCRDLRKAENNGWAKNRGFRLIARIPTLTFFEKKELTNQDGTINAGEMKKFLRSPDGEMFKTVTKGI